MIDHDLAAKQNQERMRQVYQQLSSYRNIKTPDECVIQTNTLQQQQQQQQQQHLQQQQQQKIEQQKLMPAPSLSIPHVSNQQQQMQVIYGPHPNPHSIQSQQLVPTSTDDDQNLEIDALTPSINNYQPQIISETLKRDALLKDDLRQNTEYDVYHSESGFMESKNQ